VPSTVRSLSVLTPSIAAAAQCATNGPSPSQSKQDSRRSATPIASTEDPPATDSGSWRSPAPAARAGKLGVKRHARTDGRGVALAVQFTSANVHDKW
jgi:hypothetical protein